MTMPIKGSYINGSWVLDKSLETHKINNPASLTEVVGNIQWANAIIAQQAVDTAVLAFKSWKRTKLSNRAKLALELLAEVSKQKESLARIITLENGKTLEESISEVNASIDESKFHIEYLLKNQVEITEEAEVRSEPLGVVLAITPWNFPLATIMRKIIPAIVSGNTVLVKPSEFTPNTAVAVFEIIHKISLPRGVLNLINGDGAELVSTVIRTNQVKAISFTGSDFTGQKIADIIGGRDIRFQAEMGGSNAVVVLNDATIESAVTAIVSNGFACGGQWCTGTSRVLVEESIYEVLIKKLKEYSKNIVVGNGLDKNVTMGPLSNKRQFEDVSEKLKRAIDQGAKVVLGNDSDVNQSGYFISPTILTDVTNDLEIAQQEVFGPVLTIFKVKSLNDAIDIVNNSPYGLTTSIYTENTEKANRFVDEVESGLVHVNLPTAYRKYSMPLMGWKSSGRGMPECGRFMMDLFTKPKVIYRK